MAETHTQKPRPTGRAIQTPTRYINTFGTSQTDTEPAEITYRPGPGEPKEIVAYGKTFKAGQSIEVDGRYVDKARGNPSFQIEGEKSFGDDKPKDQEPEQQPEASFEENLARERSEEYLQGRTHFASPPGEADRLARAQEAAAELKAAQDEEDDKDLEKPRGRRKAN